MNEPATRQPPWYWICVLLLLFGGVGALWTPDQGISIASPGPVDDGSAEPTTQERAELFRTFREEVAQLTPQQQLEVWQSLRERTQSLAEQTFYEFFAIADATRQQELLDRTIDRIAWRQQMGFGSFGQPPPVSEVSGDRSWNRSFSELNLEERLAARRDMWEDATAHAYAMRTEFYRLLSERRKQRGIPEPVRRMG